MVGSESELQDLATRLEEEIRAYWMESKILKVYWFETISNSRLHQATKQQHFCLILKKIRWTWFGHVYRMNNDLPTKTALTWTPEGHRKKRQAVNNVSTNNGRRTEGCWVEMGHSSKESPRQRGLAGSYLIQKTSNTRQMNM